jgi:hypothetical protein
MVFLIVIIIISIMIIVWDDACMSDKGHVNEGPILLLIGYAANLLCTAQLHHTCLLACLPACLLIMLRFARNCTCKVVVFIIIIISKHQTENKN